MFFFTVDLFIVFPLISPIVSLQINK